MFGAFGIFVKAASVSHLQTVLALIWPTGTVSFASTYLSLCLLSWGEVGQAFLK